jgi:stearoyl-CoA desaturase (delta-9 desaturase)
MIQLSPEMLRGMEPERQIIDHQAEARWSDDGGPGDRSASSPFGSMPVIVADPPATSSERIMPVRDSKLRMNWLPIFWVGLIHLGIVLAPFTFSWSGIVICLFLYMLTVTGVNVGFHRLLTHRSFQTPKPVEYILTVLGSLAGQGGVLQWVATHRAHHAHSDEEGDPHSPRDGAWWAHMLWWMPFDRVLDVAAQRLRYVRDLAKDPVHRFLDHCQVPLTLLLALALFMLGQAWGGVGLSWLVWGIFVRMTLTYHVTWLVNSATHMWGYRTYKTKDRSTNLWWVALLSFGEGWHNNHHAFPRSARHGLRWWELDLTYWTIRLMALVRLARRVQMPHEPFVK